MISLQVGVGGIDSFLSGYESFHHRGHRVSQSLINLKSKE